MKDKRWAMISQPMRGRSEQEIREEREDAIKVLEAIGYKVVDNTEGTLEPIEKEQVAGVNIPLRCLSNSIRVMALCDAVFFCKGWKDARGCRVEFHAAIAYGLQILFAER